MSLKCLLQFIYLNRDEARFGDDVRGHYHAR
jgi:hypothetical protein